MTYHLIIHYTNSDTKQTKYLVQYTNEKYEVLSYKNNAINASFDRFNAESEITKKLFPEFYKDKKKADQRHPQIKFLEFTKINELSDDKNQIFDVKSILPIDISNPYQWVESYTLENENEIFKKYQAYKQSCKNIPEPSDPKISNFLTKLVDASRKNNLVLFVGAGFSKNYGYPLWKELVKNISQKYKIEENDDILKFAQIFKFQYPNDYYPFLRSIFKATPDVPRFDFLKEIYTINPMTIVTTNYDSLLETCKYSSEYQVLSSNDDFTDIESNKLILKMHGDFKVNNIIFTENDYLSYERTHKLLRNHVLSLFASKTILIIGFSYNDVNLKKILQEVKAESTKDFNNWYIYFPDEKISKEDRDYFIGNNIDVLNYSEDINYYLDKATKIDSCNSDSFRLFSFLKILSIALKNEINVSTQNPVEQAFKLFEKYNHIPTISPYQLRKNKPFNESGDFSNAKFIPSQGILKINENQFWRRFNQIEFDYNDLSKSKDIFSMELPEIEIKWWKKIFENNWYSFIWRYGIHNTALQKYSHSKDGSVRDISEKKDEGKIKESLQKCNLLFISIDVSLDQIFEYNDAMYHLLYFGKRAYAAGIGVKLLAFYIDKKDFYNSLRIIKILSDFKYQIKSDFDSDIPQSKRDELYQFINEYDLHEKFVDYNLTRFERANFLDVFGEEIPNRLYKESYEAYLTLEDNYKKFKIEGYDSWGNDFNNDIYYTFGFLYNQAFFNYNPIFWYSNRKDFVNIFIYSNLLSVNINEKYHGHKKDGLDNFFLSVYLQLLLPKDFRTFHDRFPEIRFKFGKSAREYLKIYIKNLFTSIISQDLAGKSVLDDFMKDEMNKSYFFKQDINYQLSKILIILSYSKDIEFRDNLVKVNFENIQFLIKERIIYDDDPIREFAFILIEIDISLYESYLNTLNINPRCKDLKIEIFFKYLHDLFKQYGSKVLENKFSFIFDEFENLHSDYQILLFRFLIFHNQTELINKLLQSTKRDKIQNELLKNVFLYLKQNTFEPLVNLLTKEIEDHPIKTYTDESIFYINDENTASSLYLILNDSDLKEKLKSENLGAYFRFALFPNEINYKEINPKWLLTGHSDHNIKNLSKETIIIWLQKLVDLKNAFPDILIDHMYKKLGEALGKLNN